MLLAGTTNQEKNNKPFETWVNEKYSDPNKRKRFLEDIDIDPDLSLKFEDFLSFIEKREALIKERLKEVLNMT